jgi:hypothetical protein
VRSDVCACSAAATISGYGTCIPVQNVRQKWKILEKKNTGREELHSNIIQDFSKIMGKPFLTYEIQMFTISRQIFGGI